MVEIRTAAAAATQLLKKRENGFGATGGDVAAPRSKTKLPGAAQRGDEGGGPDRNLKL